MSTGDKTLEVSLFFHWFTNWTSGNNSCKWFQRNFIVSLFSSWFSWQHKSNQLKWKLFTVFHIFLPGKKGNSKKSPTSFLNGRKESNKIPHKKRVRQFLQSPREENIKHRMTAALIRKVMPPTVRPPQKPDSLRTDTQTSTVYWNLSFQASTNWLRGIWFQHSVDVFSIQFGIMIILFQLRVSNSPMRVLHFNYSKNVYSANGVPATNRIWPIYW